VAVGVLKSVSSVQVLRVAEEVSNHFFVSELKEQETRRCRDIDSKYPVPKEQAEAKKRANEGELLYRSTPSVVLANRPSCTKYFLPPFLLRCAYKMKRNLPRVQH
jgi:hypothetical protein